MCSLSVSIRSLPSERLRPRKEITAGRRELLAPPAFFSQKAQKQGLLARADKGSRMALPESGKKLPPTGKTAAALTI
jgi:hypothetical protein